MSIAGRLQNYEIIVQFIDGLGPHGLKLMGKFFDVTTNSVHNKEDLDRLNKVELNSLKNINESAAVRYKNYKWGTHPTEEYYYSLDSYKPVNRFLKYIKPKD